MYTVHTDNERMTNLTHGEKTDLKRIQQWH